MKITRKDKQEKFNKAAEAILNEEYGNLFRGLINTNSNEYGGEFYNPTVDLHAYYSSSSPEKLLDFYMRANTLLAKLELASVINLFFRDRGEQGKAFFFLLDSLNLQNIGDDSIWAILEKYPLLSNMSLSTSECDKVISVMLSFLEESPATKWGSFHDGLSEKFSVERHNRRNATCALVILNKYSATSKRAKKLIFRKRNLIVFYDQTDYSYEYFEPLPLHEFLSGRIGC